MAARSAAWRWSCTSPTRRSASCSPPISSNWTLAIQRCLDAAGERLPAALDRRRLAEFVLTVMEGAVMQARTYRDIGYFDRNIAMLRDQFDMLIGRRSGRRAG